MIPVRQVAVNITSKTGFITLRSMMIEGRLNAVIAITRQEPFPTWHLFQAELRQQGSCRKYQHT